MKNLDSVGSRERLLVMGFDWLDKPRKYALMGSLFLWFGETISDLKLVFLVGLDCFNGLGKRGKWVLINLESWGFREEDERIWVEIMRDSGVVCIGAESTVRK